MLERIEDGLIGHVERTTNNGQKWIRFFRLETLSDHSVQPSRADIIPLKVFRLQKGNQVLNCRAEVPSDREFCGKQVVECVQVVEGLEK